MADKKRNKRLAQSMLSILNPDNIDYSDFDAMTSEGQPLTNAQLSERGNSAGEGVNSNAGRGEKQRGNVDLAGTGNVSPFEDSTDQSIASRRGTSTRELLTDPASNIITPDVRIPFTERSAKYNPLLIGKSSFPNFTKDLMQSAGMNNNSPDIMSMQPMTPGNSIKSTTPEDRLLEAVMNTNPSPQSAWKRLLTGVGRGLGQAVPELSEGNYGGAFGKIASNVVGGMIPGVNSSFQYENNVRNAQQQYKLEKVAEQGKLSREKTQADIAETNERLRLSQLARQTQTQRDALLDAARLRDDKRADADQQLRILEKLPPNDPQRNELSRDLATRFQIRVSPQYGVENNEDITIYDQASGNYIRAAKDGTPKLDAQGNNIVVRPGKQESLKQSKDRAMQVVIEKHGGDAKSVARLSTENRKDEIINSLPKQYQDALRNPASTNTMIYDDAQKAYAAKFNELLKQNEAFTEALYEREAQDEMSNNSTRQTTGKKQATISQPTGSNKPAPGYFLKWK